MSSAMGVANIRNTVVFARGPCLWDMCISFVWGIKPDRETHYLLIISGCKICLHISPTSRLQNVSCMFIYNADRENDGFAPHSFLGHKVQLSHRVQSLLLLFIMNFLFPSKAHPT
jgi:hypothetical protein